MLSSFAVGDVHSSMNDMISFASAGFLGSDPVSVVSSDADKSTSASIESRNCCAAVSDEFSASLDAWDIAVLWYAIFDLRALNILHVLHFRAVVTAATIVPDVHSIQLRNEAKTKDNTTSTNFCLHKEITKT